MRTFEAQSLAAQAVQRRLLSNPPAFAGADIAVSWRPHGDVGGDFFDFNELEEGSIGITIGDVSGKGYDAALLMVFALAGTRAGISSGLRLPLVMGQLDEALRRFSSDSKYAEVLIGIYSVWLKRFVYVQGGGIFPVVYRQGSQRLYVYSSSTYRIPGLPQISKKQKPYVEEVVDLEEGDALLLFSDGIREREECGGELLRRDAIGALVAPSLLEICRASGQKRAQGILEDLGEYLDSLDSERTDDETVIVVKAGEVPAEGLPSPGTA